MKITSLQEYGLRILLRLAEQSGDQPVRTRTIAKEEALSVDYVEKILTRLRRVKIVKSVRGLNGGYVLIRKPDRISLGEAMMALTEKPLQFNRLKRDLCGQFPGNLNECIHLRGCSIRQLWSMIVIQVYNNLNHIFLSDLVGNELAVHNRLSTLIQSPISKTRTFSIAPAMSGEKQEVLT